MSNVVCSAGKQADCADWHFFNDSPPVATSCRSMERSLTDEEINKLQETVREKVASELKVELR